MRKQILEKFSDDFFERTKSKALKEFGEQMNLKIDTGFVYKFADEIPKFIGGEDSLIKFLGRNIKYPSSCLNGNIKGKVYCQFIIEKDGSISNIEIVRSPQECYSNEVLRVFKISPKWKPAILNSKPVRFRTIMPIRFK
ncbi:MAG: energy transducer TonB [Flavobacteriales bacterium]